MSYLPYILGGFFCLIGAGMFVSGFLALRKARSRATWPTVAGAVTSAKVVEHRQSGMGQHGRRTTRVSWEPTIMYTYTVDGMKHTGVRIRIGPETMFRRAAEKWVEQHPASAEVQVHYNPADPTEAVLDTGVPGLAGAFVMAPLLIALGALAIWKGAAVIAWFASP